MLGILGVYKADTKLGFAPLWSAQVERSNDVHIVVGWIST